MEEVDIKPIGDEVKTPVQPAEPTEIVQAYKEVLEQNRGLGEKEKDVEVEHPAEKEKKRIKKETAIEIDSAEKEKKRGKGRPITTGAGIRKSGEKHVMTQARLDALARARQKRQEIIKARRLLEKQEKEEQEALMLVGRMVVNNTRLASLENKNNLQIEGGKVDAVLGNMMQPVVPSAHKNAHTPMATTGDEYNQPNPYKPVPTVVNFDNGGVYQKKFDKDLTFYL